MLGTLRCPATPVIYPVNSSRFSPTLPSECAETANPSRITRLYLLHALSLLPCVKRYFHVIEDPDSSDGGSTRRSPEASNSSHGEGCLPALEVQTGKVLNRSMPYLVYRSVRRPNTSSRNSWTPASTAATSVGAHTLPLVLGTGSAKLLAAGPDPLRAASLRDHQYVARPARRRRSTHQGLSCRQRM
jgi:hypothetical protein